MLAYWPASASAPRPGANCLDDAMADAGEYLRESAPRARSSRTNYMLALLIALSAMLAIAGLIMMNSGSSEQSVPVASADLAAVVLPERQAVPLAVTAATAHAHSTAQPMPRAVTRPMAAGLAGQKNTGHTMDQARLPHQASARHAGAYDASAYPVQPVNSLNSVKREAQEVSCQSPEKCTRLVEHGRMNSAAEWREWMAQVVGTQRREPAVYASVPDDANWMARVHQRRVTDNPAAFGRE
ncbi:hypothetical protein QS306_16920 [Paraburkholderia bonniea]|uniref:hypothetical protein n=1 Tax=Paraburkholderia bonniea TaxID=2152891 RepID=UPI0025739C4B|nr:hypothetical protein [Paraburkholderia bonniea]WJF91752.1 hypothetical protein QS306_16920 [Paraburkholderia bonniea]WJF95072.1 hypothetical protein QS308_16925 [Paraburkholderia bonniea]